MAGRRYIPITDPESSLVFRFAFETGSSGPLHIQVRHGITPDTAIETYFNGMTTWNQTNRRFESRTEAHTLYRAWHASGAVLVITCFANGDET